MPDRRRLPDSLLLVALALALGCRSKPEPQPILIRPLATPAADPYKLEPRVPLFGVNMPRGRGVDSWPGRRVDDETPSEAVVSAVLGWSHAEHVRVLDRFVRVPSSSPTSDMLRFRGDAIEIRGPKDEVDLVEQFFVDRTLPQPPIPLTVAVYESQSEWIESWSFWSPTGCASRSLAQWPRLPARGVREHFLTRTSLQEGEVKHLSNSDSAQVTLEMNAIALLPSSDEVMSIRIRGVLWSAPRDALFRTPAKFTAQGILRRREALAITLDPRPGPPEPGAQPATYTIVIGWSPTILCGLRPFRLPARSTRSSRSPSPMKAKKP